MFKITRRSAITVSIIADTRKDIQNIPTTYGMGSTIFVIEDSSVWMLGGGDEPK